MEEYKRRHGDKRDGRLIRGKEIDTNHFVMPLVWPRRTDNEACILETIDITNVLKYVDEKNSNPDKAFNYSIFMVFAAAIGKTFINRPKMNRFYRNSRLYEKYRTSLGFIVKKSLSDDAVEALARVFIEKDDTFEKVAKKVNDQVESCRSEAIDKSSDDLRILMKFPHFVGRIVMGVMKFIDKRWAVPESISASDMFFTSCVISQLGSIGLRAGYHHLSNWGTNSFFMTIGAKKKRPLSDKEGNIALKECMDVGMTIDERIVDGLYYSRTIRLFKKYMENPWILDDVFLEETPKEEK